MHVKSARRRCVRQGLDGGRSRAVRPSLRRDLLELAAPRERRRRHARSLASRLLHSLTALSSTTHHPHLHPRYYTTRPLDIHPPPLLARNQRITLDIANTKTTRQAQSWPNACSKVAAPAALGSRSSSSYCWVSGNSAAICCVYHTDMLKASLPSERVRSSSAS
jgi:hypothetical protein